ncbi:MAG: hypothetical protein K2W85_09485 [Phycisphaerales bacterium]|nr:hypothetical protein [Phycisphaerales bacterium]
MLLPTAILLQIVASTWLSVVFSRDRLTKRKKTTRAQDFLESAQCFLCPNCHYDLNGGDDEGVCPECGTAYVRAQVVEAWRAAYLIERTFPHSVSDRPMTQNTQGEAERTT